MKWALQSMSTMQIWIKLKGNEVDVKLSQSKQCHCREQSTHCALWNTFS